MIGVGDKFIIEIDKTFEQDGEKLFRAKGFKSLVFDQKGLDKLEMFQDEYKVSIDSARIAGQDEAWKLAHNLYSNVTPADIREIFEIPKDSIRNPFSVVLDKLTAKEAIEKYSDWTEAKKKEEDEIKVGDVIITDDDYKAVVTRFRDTKKLVAYITFGDGSCGFHSLEGAKKTGKHIDIESILDQIEEV